MKQSKQERVVELYNLKSTLCSDLSKLNDTDYRFIIGYETTFFNMYGASKFLSFSQSFLAEIKIKTEEYLNQQLKEIDKELESL